MERAAEMSETAERQTHGSSTSVQQAVGQFEPKLSDRDWCEGFPSWMTASSASASRGRRGAATRVWTRDNRGEETSVPAQKISRKKTQRPRIGQPQLAEMIEQATVDCYNESEQMTGWFTVIDEHLAVPFETSVLGVAVTVERIHLNDSEQLVAICKRDRSRQALPILDLPLPMPRPAGAEWIEAFRQWRGNG